MLVTFDECYDNNHTYLILGALFNPEPKRIHNDLLTAKHGKGYLRADGTAKEIKYNYASTHYLYAVAAAAVDCFAASRSFFRAIVVDQRPTSGFSLDFFGKPSEPRAIREARAYKKFTELLLKSNLTATTNGVLFTDRLTRCKGDAFLPLITELFGTGGVGYSSGGTDPIFRHIQEVDTALEQYHVGQIGDILQGAILNELVPTRNRWKRKLREHVKARLGLPSLAPGYWLSFPRWELEHRHPEYQVWYWQPQ